MYYKGIDLGGTRIKIGLLKNQTLLDQRIIYARLIEGIAAHLRFIDHAIEDLVKKHGVREIEGIALAFPGIVDPIAKKVMVINKKYEDAKKAAFSKFWRCHRKCS